MRYFIIKDIQEGLYWDELYCGLTANKHDAHRYSLDFLQTHPKLIERQGALKLFRVRLIPVN